MRSLWIGLVACLVALLVVVQLLRPIPEIGLRLDLPARYSVHGTPVQLPWPSAGQSAVAVAGIGSMGSAGATAPQPIASLAKMMVALLVLQSHPLGTGQNGPTLTVTPADVAIYQNDLAGQQSVLPVAAGETLTERQLLQGLLIPSGNNIATLLGQWVAGSESAFVNEMNAEAQRLGMTNTHYVDASGVDSGTVSTAVDQLKVAEAAMAIPAFRHTVAMAQATLPVAGTVYNVNYYLGRGGIIGVKTGSTTAAGGCYVAAAYRTVGGQRVLVLAATLGQGGLQPLNTALQAGLRLIDAAGTALTTAQPVQSGQLVATLSAPWASPVGVLAPSTVSLVGWPGLGGTRRLVAAAGLGRSVRVGERVGTLVVTLGRQQATLTLRSAAVIPPPSLWWRLTRL